MAYLDDIAAYAHLTWENPQSVTFTAKRSAGDTAVSVAYAIRMDASKAREFFGGVALGEDETVWILPNTLLSSQTVEVSDTITEGATVWTVQGSQRVRFNHQWLARCRKNKS
jgi:hypothetical protein